MIRALTASAIIGVLVAGVAIYNVWSPPWRTAISSRSDRAEQIKDAEATIENWPICATTIDGRSRAELVKALAAEARNVEFEKLHPKFAQTFGLGHAPSAE